MAPYGIELTHYRREDMYSLFWNLKQYHLDIEDNALLWREAILFLTSDFHWDDPLYPEQYSPYKIWFASKFTAIGFHNELKWYYNEPKQGEENYTDPDDNNDNNNNDKTNSNVTKKEKGGFMMCISFRGEDTRNNFVDHLYAALTLKGIQTFKDDKMLGGGQPISKELVKAIKESRCVVVVFSKNYANSCWCLEELSNIMECHDQLDQKVLPVFYHVDPSDVRKQNGDFATAFETHEDTFKREMDKVNKWRHALTAAASLSGQHILPFNGGESAFIKKIVQQILADKQPRGGSRENHLIDIEPRVESLVSLLNMEVTEEVRIVGICGMGGIGKTTIARALFNRLAHKFQGSSFVKDVRENCKKDICAVQQKILKDIDLGACHGFEVQDPEDGAKLIQERCCNKKVLLVLDDVDDDKQLQFLAAERESFGPGSRIIITTRDQHLLSYANANDTYKPALLHTDQALELFSRHAFRKSIPPDGYMDLSIRAINYACRLPLALKVLGSFLCGREAGVWESALDSLAKTPSGEVLDTLKLSFDYLNVFEKEIFLDIACFYKGKDVDDVTRMLDSFDFDPVIGISILIEKSLIIVSSNNRLDMHDLIQEMGWKVVQESAPNSRLWQHEKIYDVIRKDKELELIEGIVVPPKSNIDLEQSVCANGFQSTKNLRLLGCYGKFNCGKPTFLPYESKQRLSADVFKSMKKLRLLDCYENFTYNKPTVFPEELRWFTWYKYPFSSLPVAQMSKLVGLGMVGGKIKHLWDEKKIILQNLKFVHLQGCDCLTRFPDVSGAPNIESLDLSFCKNMVEVDESVGSLKKLLHLDMTFCEKLKYLPSMLHMESLKTLILHFCYRLKRIPDFSSSMVSLSHIDFSYCHDIQELPSSIKYLHNLTYLNLNYCTSLKNLPNSICELKCLNTLKLYSCNKLQTLPDDFQSMESLEVLSIELRKSIDFYALTNFWSLKKLYLVGHFGEHDIPNNLHGLFSLEELHISLNSKLIQLPESISHLSSLKHLQFYSCSRLQTIHGLPSGIQVLIAHDCELLEKIENLPKKYECLCNIRFSNCPNLVKDEEDDRFLDKMVEESFLEKWLAVDGCLSISILRSPISRNNIPSWFKSQQYGSQIALKLPHGWQTKIAGFAMCFVSRSGLKLDNIKLRFENDGMFVPKTKGDLNINETEEALNVNLWMGYIPFRLFEQLHEDNNNDSKYGNWFHMTEGNLVFDFAMYLGNVERCGAQIVYRENVASIQGTIPSISSYYWSWKLTNEFSNSVLCCE